MHNFISMFRLRNWIVSIITLAFAAVLAFRVFTVFFRCSENKSLLYNILSTENKNYFWSGFAKPWHPASDRYCLQCFINQIQPLSGTETINLHVSHIEKHNNQTPS
jgi:hypothetical protein